MDLPNFNPAVFDPAALVPGAASGQAAARWRPGLAGTFHGEVLAQGHDAAGAGLALALALDGLAIAARKDEGGAGLEEKSVLWVQDAASARLTGRPYRPGLPAALRNRLIHVLVKKAEDALFAMEEGLRCRDLACVIGEVAGNPKALDFNASRRLSLTAQRHGVPLFLIRVDAARDLSSARMRWQVRSASSAPPRWNPAAPGAAAWQAELFRSRGHAPGEWILRDEQAGLVAEPTVAKAGSDPAEARAHG